jgi:tRNA wybutosine-synthesizing protein 3
MALPEVFLKRKARILNQLAVPDGEYDDLSPKGSIDEGIRELIEEINGVEGCVTTSSCAGRVAVFLEGRKVSSAQPQDGKGDDGKGDEEKGEGERERVSDYRDDRTVAKAGGKGGGGRWLFVSHDPVEKEEGNWSWAERFGMMRCEERDLMGKMKVEEVRFVHFKFEPMVCFPFAEYKL